MALPSDYISGTITLTNGSTAFTGTGTGWLAADFREGDIILDVEGGEGAVAVIASITSNTAGVLSKEWEGPTLTGVAYRMRYQWDSGRVSAQSRAAIEMLGNGNLQSFASITGPGVPVFDGPHSVTIKPESDFVNGVAYDVQVDTLADRDAYDGQSEGFAVLVSDVGDGRSALYSKESNTVGDWGAPAYVTGPVGPMPDVEATVTSLPPGSTATVTPTPIPGGYSLDFELPEASGFYNAGVYDIGSAYGTDDVVRHNGSSFIALQAVPVGESPSSAFPPVDTAYWQVLAAKGQDGAGTISALGEGDGISINSVNPEVPVISVEPFGGDSGSGGSVGGVPAPSAGDASANKFLKASGGWAVPVAAASATEVVTGTEAAKYVSPSTLKRGRGVAKAWANWNATGTQTVRNSLNISSIVDGGTGITTLNFTAAMAAADYSVAGLCGFTATNNQGYTLKVGAIGGMVAGSVPIVGTYVWTGGNDYVDFPVATAEINGDLA